MICLLDRKPKLRKGLRVLLTAVVLFVVVSMASTAAFFAVAFGRADGVDPADLTYADIDASRYPRAEISFSSGGDTLRGYLYQPRYSVGLVVISNGLRSGVDKHLPEILYFYDHGWSVLAFDGTGVGRSGGTGMRGLPQMKLDIEAAIEYAQTDPRTASLPIVLYGHSAGGYAAVAALARQPEVSAVVCIAGFSSPMDMMMYHARRYAGIFADMEYPFLYLYTRMVFGADADADALDAINSTDTPVVLIEGSGDETVPAEVGIARFRDRFENPNVFCLTVEEAGRNTHTTIWLTAEAGAYQEALEETEALTVYDRWRANQLDLRFMAGVTAFFAEAVR